MNSKNSITSICIPAYNEETSIGELLDSLILYPSSVVGEILVCANGCTDNTGAVVLDKRSKDNRIKLIKSVAGKPSAWNALVKSARYEFITFFDADILLEPGALNLLINALVSSNVIVAGGRINPVTKQSGLGDGFSTFLSTSYFFTNSLAGGGYAFKKTAIIDRMNELEFAQMPSDILAEDIWLQLLLKVDEFKFVEEANIYYDPGSFFEILMETQRRKLANRKLQEYYPELYEKWKREFRSDATKKAICHKISRFIFRINNLKGFDKFNFILQSALKITINIIYRYKLNQMYKKLELQYEQSGGAVVLADTGRRKSTKSSFA